jgi:uncharacterized protein YndB with AHSA1/START domain
MAPIRLDVTIARPLDDVFAVLTDPTLTPRWSASAISERWLTPPPVGIGSRREAVTRGLGRTMTNVAEVVAFEPGRSWTMRSVSGPAFEASAVFSPAGDGTRVVWTWDLGRPGWQRLVMAPFAPIFRRTITADLARLKSMLEAGEL